MSDAPIRRCGVLASLMFAALVDDGDHGLTGHDGARDVRALIAGELCARRYVERLSPAEVGQFTYFIRMEAFGDQRRERWRPVKIGTTMSPAKRVGDIQCSSPFAVTLLTTAHEVLLPEFFLHAEFASYRLRGEWFALHRRLRRLVDELVLFNLAQDRMHPDRCDCRSWFLERSCNPDTTTAPEGAVNRGMEHD
ncbi:MAG TPA: GIY-YIG nuclease family protein [Gemmatimonadaceae bacterium]|nr:GIY-YIG nuclease family protein [Gemmatimonadaceae bacterium]